MDFDYSIVYSRRKKVTIIVERDRSVVVRAPIGTDPEKIHQVVESRKFWIRQKINHPQKYTPLPHPPGKELVNGESLLYLGHEYKITLVDDIDEIQLKERFLVPKNLGSRKHEAFHTWYKTQAHQNHSATCTRPRQAFRCGL